jgi:hypothetical protein
MILEDMKKKKKMKEKRLQMSCLRKSHNSNLLSNPQDKQRKSLKQRKRYQINKIKISKPLFLLTKKNRTLFLRNK